MKRRTSRNLAWACIAVGMLGAAAAYAWQARPRVRVAVRDYSDRSGLPLPVEDMRGIARVDFDTPPDMTAPSLLRPDAPS